MGCFKKCCTNCATMCCFIPMAWIAFTVFDLGAAVTGGALINLGDAVGILVTMAVGDSGAANVVNVLLGGILGIVIVIMFPLHWLLQYRPGEPLWALYMMIPWILCTFISALIFAKNMKEGFLTGLFLGIGWAVLGVVIIGVLTQALGAGMVSGLFMGLTDMNPQAAVISACLEGGFVGGVFGALAGAIRYNPNDEGYTPKGAATGQNAFGGAGPAVGQPAFAGIPIADNRLSGQPAKSTAMPSSYAPPAPPANAGPTDQAPTDFCNHCGAKLQAGVQFCMNCGQKI